MTAVAVSIFCVTYVLIASRRLAVLPLGRPAGALLGAVLMVTAGVLSPRESYAAVDHDTIVLLFSMMLLTAYIEEAGFFDLVAATLLGHCRTPWRLLAGVAALAGALSAFLVNDTVCLFLTPVVVTLCRHGGLPLPPFLLALATSANLGSAATLVGNPQNMIIGSLSGMPFLEFLLRSGPAALLGLLANIALLRIYFGAGLPRSFTGCPPPARAWDRRLVITLAVTTAIIVAFFLGHHLGYSTLAGVLLLMIYQRRDPRPVFARVDYALLVFFCCLFVVVAGLAKTGLVDRAWAALAPRLELQTLTGVGLFTLLAVVGSNLVSNVPMVLLVGPRLPRIAHPSRGWVLLGLTTTLAGNLTLLGSVANIIVAECAREHHSLGFREYLRFGAVSTVVTLLLGAAVVLLTTPP